MSKPKTEPEYLTTEELADRLRLPIYEISRMVKRGMPAIRFGRKTYRFDLEAVLEWGKRNASEGKIGPAK